MYKRKTYDEYQILGNYGYGHGYEYLIAYETYKEAKECLKLYRENEIGIPFKVIKKRIKIDK